MQIKNLTFLILAGILSGAALAETTITEGEEGKALFQQHKDNAYILSQKRKKFYLQKPGELKASKAPKELTVKVGDKMFITNDEKKITHNVYDALDEKWVLTKQLPGGAAMVEFISLGEHDLRCMIHPKMKIRIKVE